MRSVRDETRLIRGGFTIGVIALALLGLMRPSNAAPGTDAAPSSLGPAARGNPAAVKLVSQGEKSLAFIENRGQFDPRVEFYVRTPGQVVWLTRDGIVFDLARRTAETAKPSGKRSLRPRNPPPPPPAERLVFAQDLVGVNPGVAIEAGETRPGVHNYFIGNDPAKWRTGVRRYADVVYRDVWAGIDLKLYGK